MKRVTLGPNLDVDLDELIRSRLLIQANSGGGKSWALRRLLEQTHGKVQQIVIDPEGEFSSLRAKFDYVLAAKQGGDTVAEPRSAQLLAQRLLELNVSAVIDIYELSPTDRKRFVSIFLMALCDAPKELWHPALIVLDEAHVYDPEHGDAESAEAVRGMASRGRKRGFCIVLATQRLSKLSKDTAAECNNKLIGRTSLDVDMARAGDELGFTKADRLKLRDLEAGEFYAFGPALTRSVEKVMIGPVVTQHPKAGALAAVVPAPSEHVKRILAKLGDLPKEAAKKAATEAELRDEIRVLKRQVQERPAPAPPKETVMEVKVIDREDVHDIKELTAKFEQIVSAAGAEVRKAVEQLYTKLDAAVVRVAPGVRVGPDRVANFRPDRPVRVTMPRPRPRGEKSFMDEPATREAGELTGTQRKILDTVAMLSMDRGLVPNREMVARWMGIHPNGGRYGSDLAVLRAEGYLNGFDLNGKNWSRAYSYQDGLEGVRAVVNGTRRAILDTLASLRPSEHHTRESLAESLGIHPNGGRFGSDLAWLRTMGVIPERGDIKLTEAAR